MPESKLALTLLSGFAALLSAWWWWRASTMKVRTVAALPPGLGDGDLAFQVGPDEFIHWRVFAQSKLNARAAVAAAVAILTQTGADYFPWSG